MHFQTRKWTKSLIDAMDEGAISHAVVAEMALSYLSEDDVKQMCLANDIQDLVDPNFDMEEDD